MDAKKLIRLVSLAVAILGGGVGYEVVTKDAPAEPSASAESSARAESRAPAPARTAPAAKATQAGRRRCVFAAFRDGDWVTGWGVVKKILPDDTVPPCHQRFLLVDPVGETLLVANNIDGRPRLADLHAGDVVEFKGEFKDTERGYLVHWTHPDSSGRRPGGYVRKGSEW